MQKEPPAHAAPSPAGEDGRRTLNKRTRASTALLVLAFHFGTLVQYLWDLSGAALAHLQAWAGAAVFGESGRVEVRWKTGKKDPMLLKPRVAEA